MMNVAKLTRLNLFIASFFPTKTNLRAWQYPSSWRNALSYLTCVSEYTLRLRYGRGVTRVGTYLYKGGITAIARTLSWAMLLDPVMASAGVSSANRLRRDASRVCTARIARVYLHRNGTRKGLYILLDVSSGRERRDENGLRANQTEFRRPFSFRFSARN